MEGLHAFGKSYFAIHERVYGERFLLRVLERPLCSFDRQDIIG